MGILATGTVSLLPKEAFDKGWRKVVVLIVGIAAMGAIGYGLNAAGQHEIAGGIALSIAGMMAAYFKINLKKHAEEIEKFLPVIQDVIKQLGGEKEKKI